MNNTTDFLGSNNIKLISENSVITPSSKTSLSIPNGIGTALTFNTLSNAGDLDLYGSRIQRISHNKTSVEVYGDRKNKIQIKNNNKDFTLELLNISQIEKSNKPAKKVFIYILHQLGKQNITENLFNDLTIEFPLTDLVDLGMYANVKTARKGFLTARDVLSDLKIKAIVKAGKSNKEISNLVTPLFLTSGIIKSTCVISLNKEINWKTFALQEFTLLPTTYFRLNSNASDLFYNIFNIARQRGKELAKKNSFNISFGAIQNWLALPSEVDTKNSKGAVIREATKNPKRDILEPILNALEEIQKKQDSSKQDFIITATYNKNGNIIEQLDKGFITVELRGEYSKKILEIDKRKNQLKLQNEERTNRIQEQAKIKALEHKLSKEK